MSRRARKFAPYGHKLQRAPWASAWQGAPRGAARTVHVDPLVVFRDVLDGMSEPKKGFAWARCPFHADRNPSFCVNVTTGWYRCYSTNCGVTGSSIAGFAGSVLGLSYKDARSYLERHYG